MIRLLRSWWCQWANGGHELYRGASDGWIYQECILCGYRTRGWRL